MNHGNSLTTQKKVEEKISLNFYFEGNQWLLHHHKLSHSGVTLV